MYYRTLSIASFTTWISPLNEQKITRGHFLPACGYEFYFRELSSTSHEFAAPYGEWARSTICSQNFGVLTKRYDNSLFLHSYKLGKIKTVLKFLWPLLVVELSIPGLIWRGTAYFVQNNTTIILSCDTRRSTSELPCRAPVTHFWRQNRSLETQNGSYFSLQLVWCLKL